MTEGVSEQKKAVLQKPKEESVSHAAEGSSKLKTQLGKRQTD